MVLRMESVYEPEGAYLRVSIGVSHTLLMGILWQTFMEYLIEWSLRVGQMLVKEHFKTFLNGGHTVASWLSDGRRMVSVNNFRERGYRDEKP